MVSTGRPAALSARTSGQSTRCSTGRASWRLMVTARSFGRGLEAGEGVIGGAGSDRLKVQYLGPHRDILSRRPACRHLRHQGIDMLAGEVDVEVDVLLDPHALVLAEQLLPFQGSHPEAGGLGLLAR